MARSIEEAVALCYADVKATALKRGRNPRWPYVPMIHHPFRPPMPSPAGRQEIVRGRAFATREEAVDYAARVLQARRDFFARRLADPQCRLLREQWGVALNDR